MGAPRSRRRRRFRVAAARCLAALLLACLATILRIAPAHAAALAGQLADALIAYRQRAAEPHVAAARAQPLPPFGARKLAPGQAYAGLAELIQRLVILGDLPQETRVPERYTEPVVGGIVAFQRRHGLEPDGVIGRETLAQLEISPAQRVRQIELNLARLRQLPAAPRWLLVNVPEFVLRGCAQDEERLRMRIVVGAALKTRTPLFVEEMRFIEFSPYWNVPPSIARLETIPRLRNDPSYFNGQGFEFYSPAGGIDPALTEENLDAVLQGRLRIRQRPGPKNALGGIKFVFPNNENIYMHHTPATRLFSKSRRDFSHGCIRVEEPMALARFILSDQPEWDEERIRAAMRRERTATLRLREPLPVVIAYLTALPGTDGRIRFFPDIYGLDRLQ